MNRLAGLADWLTSSRLLLAPAIARRRDVAILFCEEIDKRLLERRLGPVDLSGVTVIGMDEFAIHRGHRYATVVIEPARKRVLWVGRDRWREGLRPFFTLLGPEGCAALEAVVMDMNGVAKYGREVIDRVRVDEANRVREDRRARRLVRGARWLLLRNRENVSSEVDQVRLSELPSASGQAGTAAPCAVASSR
jgi:transposase